MIPVTLAKLDNYPGFLGSFDNITWWKGEQLPGAVEYVNDAVWVYGQYHICLARMQNGTYSIYQSKDDGFSWISVLNLPGKISSLLRLDYGRALAATSTGWYRSENSGTTWTKVSSSAPNCICVKELTNDVLVAIDGTYVWHSENAGTNWTKSVTATWNGTTYVPTATTLISKTTSPAIDGTIYDCLVGCTSTNCETYYDYFGTDATIYTDVANTSRLIISDDGGVSFYYCTPTSSWAFRELYPSGYSASSENGYPSGMPRDIWTDIITDIELTHIKPNNTPCWVIQVRMKNGQLRHYYVNRLTYEEAIARGSYRGMFEVFPRFDANATISNSLMSDESQITGTTSIENYVLFSGTDVSNKPMIKLSQDAGYTWVTPNIQNAPMYTGPDLTQLSSSHPFQDDVYVSYTFTHGACHNYWHIISEWSRRGQSFDMDYRTAITRSVPLLVTLHTAKRYTKAITPDILMQKRHTFTYTADILNQAVHLKGIEISEVVKKAWPAAVPFDLKSVLRSTKSIIPDILIRGLNDYNLLMHAAIQKQDIENSCSMTVNFQGEIVQDILNIAEEFNVQFWDIGTNYERRPYPIFDSRKQGKV